MVIGYSILWKKWHDVLLDVLNQHNRDLDEDDFLLKAKLSNNENYSGPVITGNFGTLPLSEHNVPSAMFNLWLAHTNFRLNGNILGIVDNVDGVETLLQI